MKLHTTRRYWVLMALLTCLSAHAQQTELRPVSETWALQHVNIVEKPGVPPVFGHILIENGIIRATGPDIAIPGNARIIEGDSMYVYAGFISGLSYIGIPDPEQDNNSPRVEDPGNPGAKRAGIQPQILASDLLDPENKGIESFRKAGFTMVQSVPRGFMMPGQGTIIMLHGDSPDEMIVRDRSSLYAQWRGARGVYPSNLLGVTATWKDMYRQASYQLPYQEAYDRNPVGKIRPQVSQEVKALFPVVSQAQAVMFHADDLLAVRRAMTLAEDLGFRLSLGEVAQCWSLAEEFANNKDLQVFLTLDLPEIGDLPANPDTIADPIEKEIAMLNQRKYDAAINHVKQAVAMHNAGVVFGFSTVEVKSKDVMTNLQLMMEYGLTADATLAALTTSPAVMLNLEKVAGSVTPGKFANLVVMTGPFGEESSKIKMTTVEGVIFEYEAKKKKASSGDAEPVELAGTWNYTVDSPQGSSGGTITFEGQDGDYTGTIQNPRMGGDVDLEDIEVDGNTVYFSYSVDGGGRTFTISVEVEVDGDVFDGQISIGEFGSYDIEGEKQPEE